MVKPVRPALPSIILSTYNQPAWLEKVLWGYSAQQYKSFEIVIADDGSESLTRQTIDRMRAATGMTIRHVWHPDNGFQKCAIMNKAILAATGDYLIFTDGDCIARNDFVGHHVSQATPGRFLSGGYYKLPMELSRAITADDIRSGDAFTIGFLRRGGIRPSRRDLRIVTRGIGARLCNALTTTKATWNGNNSSGWREDLVAVGGFDERMRYGGEDRELGQRLENTGIRGKHIRYQTVLLHLDHSRGYVNDTDLQRNLAIRAETKSSRIVKTQHGIRVA
jgi:glycosyltransferase involved in cell wall biosynthesis